MSTTSDIVARLWNLCNVLKDDGITYHQYVTELTYILFLKMAEETGTEGALPEGYRWRDLAATDGTQQLAFYRQLLTHLGNEGRGKVRDIFADSSTSIRQPRNLTKLVKDIGDLDWYSAREEGLGDLYEGLLEKNANEKKSGAGQYFTPRPLIEAMVALVKPKAGELIQDPAAGTGGFLINAYRHIYDATDGLSTLTEAQAHWVRKEALVGVELVPDTHRLLLMNALLHGMEGRLSLADALSPSGAALPKADVILTNPPFGTKKGGGLPTRDDFTYPTSNKQLAFLEHVYRALKPGGRAAVVLPDNVLFEDGVGVEIRRDLMNKCDLHTILRLPTGIFYAQGVKTNVLFFTRGTTDTDNTKAVWIYDMRANMPRFGKRTPFTRAPFADFEAAFGADPYGKAPRVDTGEAGRFRSFSRAHIADRNENLDLSWIRDESATATEDLPEPEDVADRLLERFETATREIMALRAMLAGDVGGAK